MFSVDYIQQLKKIHANPKKKSSFGGKLKELGDFEKYLTGWNPTTLLDYGCGKGAILSHLKTTYPQVNMEGYDPAVLMFSTVPTKKFECVFSNDVLEHIEPEFIDNVLEHIRSLGSKYIWLRIDTKPARKTLPDGRNAHLIQETPDWWIKKVSTIISPNIVYKHANEIQRIDIAIEL